MESFETKNIRASMIIEVIGRPPEHLIETLKEIIDKISKEPRVEIIEQKIAEPQPLKDNDKFYSSFADIEINTEEIIDLVVLMFKYMPAHIEVISPEKITLSNYSWSETLSELVRRLHGYDEIVRVTQVEKKILEQKLREILEQQKQEKNSETKKEEVEKENSEEKKPETTENSKTVEKKSKKKKQTN